MNIKTKELQYTLFYGVLRPDGVHEFRECKSLLPLEVADLYEVCMMLNSTIRYMNMDYSVKKALLKVRDLHDNVKGLSLREEFEIEHAVREYLWEYFVLADCYESMCKKHKDDELIRLFDEMKLSVEFHLAKICRNFATHVGEIVHNFSLSTSKIDLYADRQTLLERIKMVKTKLDAKNRKDNRMTKNIEILERYRYDKINIQCVIEASYCRLAEVQLCLNKILRQEQKENFEKIKRFYKLVNPEKYNTKRWMILGSDILTFGKETCLVDWDAYRRMSTIVF